MKTTPQQLKKFETWAVILLPIFYLVGIISHGIDALLPYMILLTPYTILATAVIGFAPFLITRNTRILLWALVTFLITQFLETLGVMTGLVFGAYEYGATLGLQLFGVPLLIGINWILVILGCVTMAETAARKTSSIILLTAAMAVLFDWIMEPVAIALDYWAWEGGPIPLQNYIAWGGIALAFAWLYRRMNLKHSSRLPSAIVIIQGVFFLALRFLVV